MFMLVKGKSKNFNKNDELGHPMKVLEKELEVLKENLTFGQRLVSIGSWTYDIQRDEIFVSDEIYNILGCGYEEFYGKIDGFYSFIHPDDLEEVKEVIQGALEGKEYDIEFRIITPDGTVRYVHEKTKILHDENNNPIKIIGIIQDITKRKILENDLKAIGENLVLAQRIAGVGCWKYDVLKDEFFGTEEVYRIYGVELNLEKDIRNLFQLLNPDDRAKIQNAFDRCLTGKAYQIEYCIPQPDGTKKYVRSKGEPLFGNEGQVVGILGTILDITEKKLLEEQLKKNCESLSKAQALAHIGSWEVDIVNKKYYLSEEAYRIFGITPEQFDGTHEGFFKLLHPDDIAVMQNIIKNPPSQQPFDMEFRIIRADDSVRYVYQLVKIISDEDGNPVHIYGTIQDITEKKELEKNLHQTRDKMDRMYERFQALIQESFDVFEIIAPDGTIQYISPAVEKYIGFKPEERIGKNVFELVETAEKPKLIKLLESALNYPDRVVKDDIMFISRDGKKIYLEITMCNQLTKPSIQGIVVNWRDITKRIMMENRIAYLATHDELTKLSNGVYFKKKIKLMCKPAEEKQSAFAMMILDIDGLKYINDALGYECGDQLIVQISQRLKNCLDETSTICRYFGGQFAIVVQGLNTIEEYNGIAKNIMDLFLYPFNIEMYQLYITISMGISIYPDDGQDYDSLMKHANIALLQAKDAGKNIYKFYSSNMDINSYKQIMLRSDLRKAIEKDQVKVYYQPLVNLQTNEILAAEALIRWEHPIWGLVTPGEFISLAEESGYIINLGHWMLREVCLRYKKWLSNGLPAIKLSVNYSSIQFFEKNFIENIKNTLDEFELNPDFLIIEITESVLIKNSEKVISDIKCLQAMGIQVAIDDFGTGVSSLAYLNTFNIDILKIDRSFIKNIPFDETSAIITRTVINLARDLRIEIVAEGIENWDQLFYLRKLNCNIGQGFLYSKPVSEQNFERLLAKKRCRPVRANDTKVIPREQRRKFFRINFLQLLEADMTILEIGGKKANVGNTKVVIKDIGPGGLCFISNIKLPVRRELILKFTTELLGKEINLYGCPVWTEEEERNLNKYGIEFTFDENEREALIRLLNQFQIKMRNNPGFAGGRFISDSLANYFKVDSRKN